MIFLSLSFNNIFLKRIVFIFGLLLISFRLSKTYTAFLKIHLVFFIPLFNNSNLFSSLQITCFQNDNGFIYFLAKFKRFFFRILIKYELRLA